MRLCLTANSCNPFCDTVMMMMMMMEMKMMMVMMTMMMMMMMMMKTCLPSRAPCLHQLSKAESTSPLFEEIIPEKEHQKAFLEIRLKKRKPK